MRYFRLIFSIVLFFTLQPLFAAIRQDHVIPPTFTEDGRIITPSKISEIYVHYIFDVAKQKVFARSRIKFTALAEGLPFMDLIPNPTKVIFNNKSLKPSDFYEVKTPQKETTVRVLNHTFKQGERGVLDVEYELNKNVVFKNEGVGASFFMTDLSDRGFFEQYGPANFEFDQIEFSFDVEVIGSVEQHEIFTNGRMTKISNNQWHIVYPSYFTSSSIFFHLAPVGTFFVQRDIYHNIHQKQIPMIFFSPKKELAIKGVQEAKQYLAEFEGIFGEFGHDQIIVYITPKSGGMEYPGAATSSLGALRHELNHSWFARCIMPASGNASWIDEAIASWADDGFPRASTLPSRRAVNMAGMPPFTRATNRLAYTLGRDFISELDLLFKDIGGMKKFLKMYYGTYKYQVVSTTIFQQLAEQFYGKSLAALFDRYVFGIDKVGYAVSTSNDLLGKKVLNQYHIKWSDAEMRELILPTN